MALKKIINLENIKKLWSWAWRVFLIIFLPMAIYFLFMFLKIKFNYWVLSNYNSLILYEINKIPFNDLAINTDNSINSLENILGVFALILTIFLAGLGIFGYISINHVKRELKSKEFIDDLVKEIITEDFISKISAKVIDPVEKPSGEGTLQGIQVDFRGNKNYD